MPGVYGIPDAWPNIQALLADAGFDDEHGQIEVIFAGNPTRASAYDNRQFDLIVSLCSFGRNNDLLAVCRQRVGIFRKQDRHLRDLRPGFLRVPPIVQPDANDLADSRQARRQLEVRFGAFRLRATDHWRQSLGHARPVGRTCEDLACRPEVRDSVARRRAYAGTVLTAEEQ